MRFSLIVALIIALLTLIFAYQNAALVVVSLGTWQFQASLAAIALLTLFLGFVMGLLVSLPAIMRRGWKSSRRKQTIQELEQALDRQQQTIADQKRRIEFLERNLPQGIE
ncbi:LapA family protein [Lyngbya confervoides]|uniref:LapA family protein n=1 Tax=Lyngbya confervoides BDU141951 TaxID=1574623 RepID=A0ABD4T2P9_9CYAN|nr:LapA family protein [Lyngbya confervoides]MCM1982512.1 LapA family protein [Lyngbya confervoides BDU141951]